MSIRCKLLGHEYGDRDVERDVEVQPDGFYDHDGNLVGRKTNRIIRESYKCQRCGHNKVNERETDAHKKFNYDINVSDYPPKTISPERRLHDEEVNQFYSNLRKFVRSEKNNERETGWKKYSEISDQLTSERENISGPFIPTQIEKTDSNTSYWFKLIKNDGEYSISNDRNKERKIIYKGNICIADVNTSIELFPIEVRIKKVRGNTLALRPTAQNKENKNYFEKMFQKDKKDDIYLYPILNPVPYERRLDAIKDIQQDSKSNSSDISKKFEILSGNKRIRFKNSYPTPAIPDKLNYYQQKGFIWADATNDVILIHGPPGTGKTRTLVAYIKNAVKNRQSVLVTAHSNQAVDNLIVGDSTTDEAESGTLHEFVRNEKNVSISRIGNDPSHDVVKKFYTDTPSDKANIVAATTNTASTFDKNEFDVGVIDEATQASRPATAIAVKCSKKIVLAGDHKQLPPYSADEGMQNKEMHISLFEYLIKRYGEDITVFLKRQYRMNESIAQFPSEEFYGGRLETAEQNQDWRIKDLKPLVGVDVPGEEKQPQDSNSYYNVPEAKEVAKHVTVLVNRHNVDPSDIGVITAYSGQIPKIKEEINNKNVSGSQHIVVDSIDSFQGAEKEAIIVSFVRCNKDNNSGFLELPNQGRRRLNVAITRARKRLVLIGDWETLATTPTYKEESCAPVYGRLAETMRSNGTMLER